MNGFFSEGCPIATVLLVSPSTASNNHAIARALTASFPDNFYLASEHPFIPPSYYLAPSVGAYCEQALAQAKETLFSLGTRLGILPERCLLLFRYFPHFSKRRLQRQLVRQLNCPVRLLTTAEDRLWLHLLGLSCAKSFEIPATRSRLERGIKEAVKVRYLASPVVF